MPKDDFCMYEKICKDRFDKLDTMHAETIGILRGRNGEPGLLDDVRAIKRTYRHGVAVVVFIAATAGAQLIHSVWTWVAGYF